ncbi:MAG: AAA family ATPase [Thermomicrobiales bacterium]
MDLLEREQHLDQLEEHLRQAAAGHGRVVFVAGEAGVGKTTLVDAFRRWIADQADIGRFSCDGLSTPGPLGPIRDLAAALGFPSEPQVFGGEAREELFRAILAVLSSRQKPMVLIGEDAHWADGASLEFVRFLGRRVGDLPILVVITYRDDELGNHHPLRVIVGDLATAPDVYRTTVQPLSVDAVRRMSAGSERDPAALHRLTGGNPFFVTEVLAADGERVPSTVGDAVRARAVRLSPEARAVLELAAVIGVTIDLDLLQRVAGPVLDETDECLARGLLHGIDDALIFRHALAREAILASITLPRRRLLHARILAALREEPPGGRKLELLAHHAEAAGDRQAVLEFAIPAAEQAAAMFAHHEAAAQFARALRFGDALPPEERARLFEGRSAACHLSDQGEEAIAARREALRIWRSLGDPLKEGDNLRWLSRLFWYAGLGAEAEEAANAALAVLEPLPPGPELAMAYSHLAQMRMLADDLDGTLQWGQRAIELAERLGETETLIHALANVGTARQNAGDAGGAEDLTRSLQLARSGGFIDHAARAMSNLAWDCLWSLRLDEANRWLEAAIDFANEHDLDFYRWYFLATQATVRARQGAWDAAEEEILALLRQPALSPLTQIVALTTLGQVYPPGQPDAAATLDKALALAERTGQVFGCCPSGWRVLRRRSSGDTSRGQRRGAHGAHLHSATAGVPWQRAS